MIIRDTAQLLNFEIKGEAFVGKRDGYFFSLTQIKHVSVLDGFLITFKTLISYKQRLKIQNKLKTVCLFQTVFSKNDSLFIIFPKYSYRKFKSSDQYIATCVEMIDRAISIFKEHYLTQDLNCFICKRNDDTVLNNLTKKIYNKAYVVVHEQCASDAVLKFEQELINYKPSRLGLSIFLAIIGAIIGFIPSVFTIIILNYIFALLYAIVPIGAFIGYKIGKAPRKRYMTSIIVVISISLVIIFEFIAWHIIALSYHTTLFEMLKIAEVKVDFIKSLMMSLIFIGLGIFISWRYITNTFEKEHEGLKKLQD